MGQTVIGDPSKYVRMWYASAATERLSTLPVHGLAASHAVEWWEPELSTWRAVPVPAGLMHLVVELAPLWTAGATLDMHQWLFRLRHGLSGSYCSLHQWLLGFVQEDLPRDR